jgi:hypothetical protein
VRYAHHLGKKGYLVRSTATGKVKDVTYRQVHNTRFEHELLYTKTSEYDAWLVKQNNTIHAEKKDDRKHDSESHKEEHNETKQIIENNLPELLSSESEVPVEEEEEESEEEENSLTRKNSENVPSSECASSSEEQPLDEEEDFEPVPSSTDDEVKGLDDEVSTGDDEAEVREITAWARNKENELIYETWWEGYEDPSWEPSSTFRLEEYDKKRKSWYLELYTNFLRMKKEQKLKKEERVKLRKKEGETKKEEVDEEEKTVREETIKKALVNRIRILNIIAENEGNEITIPNDRKEAKKNIRWEGFYNAEVEEVKAFDDLEVWELVPRPKHRRVIGVRFAYDIKIDSITGKISRYKARLVAKGYAQIEGVDYTETFAPTMHIKTARALLKKAAKHKCIAEHYDVSTAFLHASLKEEVYVEQPEGHEIKGKEDWVYKLNKAMYGLKNAPRAYSDHFQGLLTEMGFKQASSDDCLWVLRRGKSWLYYLYYVDDIMVVGNDEELKELMFLTMKNTLNIRKEGNLEQFLGMVVHMDDEYNYTMDQEHFIKRIAKKFNVTKTTKEIKSPGDPTNKLSSDQLPTTPEEKRVAEKLPFRELLGSLIYVAKTRLDICYHLSDCARFLSGWGVEHYQAAIRILQYLLSTSHIQLIIKSEDNMNLSIYCDANYGDRRDGGKRNDTTGKWRSQGGYIVYLGSTPVGWRSKRHKSTSLSSMESEYMEASEGGKEAIWFRRLMIDLDEEQTQPTELYEDNKACYEFSKNNTCHDRTKHIDQRAYFLRELVKKGEIVVVPVKTKDQLADIMTKAQTIKLFKEQRDRIYSYKTRTVRRLTKRIHKSCPCVCCFVRICRAKKTYAYVEFMSEHI